MSAEGFHLCGHCHRVVNPTQRELDVAENAPDSQATLKCPLCRHWSVRWQFPSQEKPRPKPVPVSTDSAAVFFAAMKQAVNAG